jgi:hypothetical protein
MDNRSFFSTASRLALGPTQIPIRGAHGAFPLRVNGPGCETDHSPPPLAKAKDVWSYTSTLPYNFMAWCLIKHRDNFTCFYCLRVSSNACFFFVAYWPRSESTTGTGSSGEIKVIVVSGRARPIPNCLVCLFVSLENRLCCLGVKRGLLL